jgi:hypothetical protein
VNPLHLHLLGMRNSPTGYGTHWNIQDYQISQDKVRLVRNVGIFWYIGLGYRISLYPHAFARAQPNVNINFFNFLIFGGAYDTEQLTWLAHCIS